MIEERMVAQLKAIRPTSVATSSAGLLKPDINIAHVRRSMRFPTGRMRDDVFSRAEEGEIVKFAANLPTAQPEHGALELVDRVVVTEDLRDAVVEDICLISKEFESLLGLRCVRAKLQVANHSVCTQFHTDYCTLRVICTYIGPGTVYLDNGGVGWDRSTCGSNRPDQEKPCQQTEAGDLLYMKGHHFDAQGSAAIHRSPLRGFNGPRLILVVDDILEP